MNDATKCMTNAVGPISSTEMPEWVREMNEHYLRTGTIRDIDAARLRGSNDGLAISAPACPADESSK